MLTMFRRLFVAFFYPLLGYALAIVSCYGLAKAFALSNVFAKLLVLPVGLAVMLFWGWLVSREEGGRLGLGRARFRDSFRWPNPARDVFIVVAVWVFLTLFVPLAVEAFHASLRCFGFLPTKNYEASLLLRIAERFASGGPLLGHYADNFVQYPEAILVAVVEELCFRWLMLDALCVCLPTWVALLLSSLVFGFLHGQDVALAGTLHGLAYGLLRLHCRSLFPAILAHGLGNAFSMMFW